LAAKVRRIFLNSKYSSSNACRFAEEISQFAENVPVAIKLSLSLQRQTNDFGRKEHKYELIKIDEDEKDCFNTGGPPVDDSDAGTEQ
jgi:hypothetical protein